MPRSNAALLTAGLWMILSLAAGHLTEQQKSTIIDMHNDIRSQVRPSAAFMQKVVWDETLRLVAEGYAAKCVWDHNPELANLTMGENLFVTTGPFNETKAVLDWYNEHHDYDYESDSCPEDKMCGHYTQMVWADSTRIGCATHVCETLEGLDFEKATILVCNYYPQGNFEGMKPYESGVPCSKCPENLPQCEENICVVEDIFPSEEPNSEATEHPAVFTKLPAVPPHTAQEPGADPEEPSADPEEPTEGHTSMEKTGTNIIVMSSASEVERTSLLMVVWFLAAFIL